MRRRLPRGFNWRLTHFGVGPQLSAKMPAKAKRLSLCEICAGSRLGVGLRAPNDAIITNKLSAELCVLNQFIFFSIFKPCFISQFILCLLSWLWHVLFISTASFILGYALIICAKMYTKTAMF